MRFIPRTLLLLGLAALLTPSPAAGQSLEPVEVELDRTAAELREVLDRPVDEDTFDTALVFTNTGRSDRRIVCRGFDDDGNPVGRIAVKVPGLGLRFILASDVSNDTDFLGQVQCGPRGRIVGSAYLLGAGPLTKVSARNRSTRIVFPVVLTR